MHRSLGNLLLGIVGLASSVAAQGEASLDERAAKLRQEGAAAFAAFAKSAESAKQFAGARRGWQCVVVLYDGEHKVAKAALAVQRAWTDQGSAAQQRSIEQAWGVVTKRFAAKHRDLGTALLAANEVVPGTQQLEHCLRLDPGDSAAHQALGHESHNGFYGTAEQIAFLRRAAAIEAKAKEIAATEFPFEPLAAAQMPIELTNAGFAVAGAKTRGWKVWSTSGGAEVAGAAAQWAERGQELVEFTLPSGPLRRSARVDARPVHWVLLVRSEGEWRRFFEANPDVLAKAKLTAIPEGVSCRIKTATGDAEVLWHPASLDADNMVAHVAMWGFATRHNDGLGQGFVHAMTSLLVGSTNTWFGRPPKTRAASDKPLPRDPLAWSQRLRQELRAGQDVPLVQVPREKLTSFREAVRVKAWSFVSWLMARHPDNWPRVFEAIVTDKNPMPEAVEAAFQAELGRPLAEIEAEWREWAAGDSAFAKAARSGG